MSGNNSNLDRIQESEPEHHGPPRTQSSSSARFEIFSEAVPLSLSSMAHASLPLEEGVLDGLKQVLQHTLLSCVNYARIMHPPHLWTFRDIATTQYAWEPVKGVEGVPSDIPFSLEKMDFKHQYVRNALIYLKAALPPQTPHNSDDPNNNTKASGAEHEHKTIVQNWTHHVGILGRISLLYISTEPLTKGELDGSDVDDMPPCILYKVIVEYRSLPPTGNKHAVQAEELSMLSFGGSVDDNVKYGALASLYDIDAKYVLEIYSVRGKKYKFDLMDSTLSNGTIPSLPASRDGDPFVKSLCVTVTDHDYYSQDQQVGKAAMASTQTIPVDFKAAPSEAKPDKTGESDGKTAGEEDDKKFAITRMHLLLEGKPRHGKNFDDLPPLDYVTNGIKASYLLLNPEPQRTVTAMPSGYTLLLDPVHAGRIYINGGYITSWGQDARIGSHGTALFGMDLHSIPMWHNRIVNYEALKVAYGQLWHELLIDARLSDLNIARLLLYRLMKGHDPEEDPEDEYDDAEAVDEELNPDVHRDCLESQVLGSSEYDRVGIAPKALATRFATEFGKDAFPCQEHEVEWVRSLLPDRKPIIVPLRLINVLRRGGYFDAQRTFDDLWFLETRPPNEGAERELVTTAIELLSATGCDISYEQIAFVSAPPIENVIRTKTVCRYSDPHQQYCIHEKYLEVSVKEFATDEAAAAVLDGDEKKLLEWKAYLLGLYIAKNHPDGNILPQYVMRSKPVS